MSLHTPLPFSESVETIPQDEADDIAGAVQAVESILQQSRAKTGEFRGDVHVKTHGYARGELRVVPQLPAELAQGLFEREGTYGAVVRFSNASNQPQADLIPDGRGMSIKVFDVPGERIEANDTHGATQDFVMINHPVFFAKNVKEYLRVEKVLAAPGAGPLEKLETLTGGDWNPWHWHWREMLTVAQVAVKAPSHPADLTYFSMAPIRYGEFIAKYRVKPLGERSASYVELLQRLATDADAMRVALEETLRAQELRFEFQVQLRRAVGSMPVEDPTIEWPESESPYQTVAHLELPRQEIAPRRTDEAFTLLGFDVWHALKAHRPLGGINRARRAVYAVSANWRRRRPG